MTSLSGPASVPWNSAYQVDVEVCNHGQSSTPFQAELIVYHTPDQSIEGSYTPGVPDPFQGYVDVPMLAPSECFQAQVGAVAAGPMPRPGYLAATIDEGESIVELIETNSELLGDAMELTP